MAMQLIGHRVNTLERLRGIPVEHGIEIDVRERDGALCAAHDPFTPGQPLEDLLAASRHALVVFNIKSDGVERRLMDLAARYHVKDYFLLDVANPTLIRLTREGIRKVAVRYSEYEPLESALTLAGKADWVWIDCFTRLPLDRDSYRRLREHFKICLVSPELQHHPRGMIRTFRERLREMPLDGVCTDHIGDWLDRD